MAFCLYVVVAVAGGGCSGAGGAPAGGAGGNPGAGGSAGMGGGSPVPDAGMMNEPRFGLTARPANTTCKPPASSSQMAETLSGTGCFDPTDPSKPGPALIPYDVASPLWSDGAEKTRYFAIPEGTQIHIKNCGTDGAACKSKNEGGTPQDEGHLDFPVGSILVKTFGFANKLHETRLFVRFREDLWKGYSYRWRADGKDADLEPDDVAARPGQVQDADGKPLTWLYPSRPQCLQCHTEAAGVTLGPDIRQLNIDFKYPSGVTSNQIETLSRIGVFDAPLPAKLDDPLPHPQDGAAPLAARARSYLHVNCGLCHRPYSNFEEFDLRYSTPLGMARVCNVDPTKGELGVAGAKRLVPGKPAQSLVTIRMHLMDMNRMPQIGTSVVDRAGVKVVEDWIAGLGASCP